MPDRIRTSAAVARRAVAAIVLAAVALAATGAVSSPAVLARLVGLGAVADAEVAYPCQGCGCGCSGSRECWTACCCHGEHERLVWALEHGVQPPPFVRFTDAQWIAAANAVRPGSASCAACVVGIRASLAQGRAWGVRPAGDHAPAASCCAKPSGESRSPGTRAARTSLPCMSALGCKGQAPLVPVGVPPAIAPRAPEVRCESIPARPTCAAPAPFGLPVTRALDVVAPPPRRAA